MNRFARPLVATAAICFVTFLGGCAMLENLSNSTSSGDGKTETPSTNNATETGEVLTTKVPGTNQWAFAGARYATNGTIAQEGNGGRYWKLKGSMTFPTGGYKVGSALATTTPGSAPPQVTVKIPLTVPRPDAVVTQVISTQNVEALIPAAGDAVFTVVVETRY